MVKLTKLDKSFIIRNKKIIINKDKNYINTISSLLKLNDKIDDNKYCKRYTVDDYKIISAVKRYGMGKWKDIIKNVEFKNYKSAKELRIQFYSLQRRKDFKHIFYKCHTISYDK
jgi:hypothetical protein